MEKIAELVGKAFCVGYMLPVGVFILANAVLFKEHSVFHHLISFDEDNNTELLIGTTALGLISWLGGFLLMALNREIIRALEGYGTLNPLRLFLCYQQIWFRALSNRVSRLETLKRAHEEKGTELPFAQHQKLGSLKRRLVERYPDSDTWLLPTGFGNITRAAEVYSRVMYGLDAIPAWFRLQAVIPKSYWRAIDDVKATLDFWINLLVLTAVLLVECVSCYRNESSLWIYYLLIVSVFICYSRACSSALRRGEYIKAAFDVFIPALFKKLSFEKPPDPVAAKQQWTNFSRAVIYRQKESMPPRQYSDESESSVKEEEDE